jgi:hypothetical protein
LTAVSGHAAHPAPRWCRHRGFYIPKKPLQIKAEARHAITATGVLALMANPRPDQAAFAG